MIWARFSLNGSKIVFRRLTVLMLLVGALLIAGAARAQNICPNNILPLGNGESLAINKECHVRDGAYSYDNVNIIAGGSLIFDEGDGSQEDRLLGQVDNHPKTKGKLIAGSLECSICSKGGVLTIHLLGPR